MSTGIRGSLKAIPERSNQATQPTGVDFPALTIALSTGAPVPGKPMVGRAGVRTLSAMALTLGAAERHNSRAAVLRILLECAPSHVATSGAESRF